MHLADGIVSGQVLAAGTLLAAGGCGWGLKNTDYDQLPQVALLSAAFFVASLIHIPVGPGQVHLILNGLTGIILGWAAFPALLVALLLQAVLFGYGGLTVLGVNTLNMALPGVLCFYLFRPLIVRKPVRPWLFAAGFAAGSLAVAGSGLMLAATLYLSDQKFLPAAGAILLAHVPVMLIEGVITGSALVFLSKVAPHILTNKED